MQNELKLCPFCGDEVSLIVDNKDTAFCYVACKSCRIFSEWFTNKEKAIDFWNTRQPVDNWKPIEELAYTSGEILLYSKVLNQFNICTFLNKDITTDDIVVIDGFRGYTLKEIKKNYSNYALLTPPQTNQSNN